MIIIVRGSDVRCIPLGLQIVCLIKSGTLWAVVSCKYCYSLWKPAVLLNESSQMGLNLKEGSLLCSHLWKNVLFSCNKVSSSSKPDQLWFVFLIMSCWAWQSFTAGVLFLFLKSDIEHLFLENCVLGCQKCKIQWDWRYMSSSLFRGTIFVFIFAPFQCVTPLISVEPLSWLQFSHSNLETINKAVWNPFLHRYQRL